LALSFGKGIYLNKIDVLPHQLFQVMLNILCVVKEIEHFIKNYTNIVEILVVNVFYCNAEWYLRVSIVTEETIKIRSMLLLLLYSNYCKWNNSMGYIFWCYCTCNLIDWNST
jgi:hypothetical protein